MKINNKGFTLIELMVATTAFSLILLIASATAIQIGKMYYKSIMQSKTQEVARSVVDEVSQTIMFASGSKMNGAPGINQFCFGDTRYTWAEDVQVTSDQSVGLRVSRKNSGDPCAMPIPADVNNLGRQLLSDNMRVISFSVEPVTAENKMFRTNIKIASTPSNGSDLLTSYNNDGTKISPDVPAKDIVCKTGISGSNFCAISSLDNLVKKRLNL